MGERRFGGKAKGDQVFEGNPASRDRGRFHGPHGSQRAHHQAWKMDPDELSGAAPRTRLGLSRGESLYFDPAEVLWTALLLNC